MSAAASAFGRDEQPRSKVVVVQRARHGRRRRLCSDDEPLAASAPTSQPSPSPPPAPAPAASAAAAGAGCAGAERRRSVVDDAIAGPGDARLSGGRGSERCIDVRRRAVETPAAAADHIRRPRSPRRQPAVRSTKLLGACRLQLGTETKSIYIAPFSHQGTHSHWQPFDNNCR